MSTDMNEMEEGGRELDEGNDNVDSRVDKNLEPNVGMEFESDEAAKKFYNDYSKCIGFSIRTNSAYRTKSSKKDSSFISRTFVCSKEGHRRNKDTSSENARNPRPSIREGCKAMLAVKKQETGLWVVSKFEKEHNHPLTSLDRVFLLRSHRRLSGPEKQSIAYDTPGMSLGYTMNGFKRQFGAIRNVAFTEKGSRDYVGKGRLNSYGIDVQLVLDYFKCMQATNPAFFYAVEVDQDDCLSNVFWADARSRNTYSKFGDVVTFDMKYKKNQYQLPFAPFIGVNHHQQSVLFGSALLSDETESTFVWLFQTWLEAMSGRHPKVIITDEDKAMKAAIVKVFPETRHHYCRWHILKKVQEKLSHVCNEHKDFNLVFHNCVNNSETVHEFESSWSSILDRYNLRDNDWLRSLYEERGRWVPVYLQGTFFAGMSTTERSESVSSLFKGYVSPSTSLNEFVKQYELALEKRYEKEVIEDFNTSYSKPFLRTPLPMEEQASKIYTRNIFKKFQEQLIQSLLFAVNNNEEIIDTYRVSKFDESKVYNVTFNSTEMKAFCPCMMWEFEGILCKHVLAVFRAKNIFMLPSHYILNRWTKDAKKIDVCTKVQDNTQEHMSLRFNSLWQEALKFAEEGASSVRVYKEAMVILREAMEKLTIAKQKIEIDITVHPDPEALFYESQCGSHYGPAAYDYSQYNSEDNTETTSG